MSTIGLVLHTGRAMELAASIAKHLIGDRRVELLATGRAGDVTGAAGEPSALTDLPVAESAKGMDLVVSLGGDGTMLRAVDAAAQWGVPVLGVNLGRLGYLTEVQPDDAISALERTLAGEFVVDERMRLEASSSALGPRFGCLNEVVVEKSEPGHMVRLEVALDGRPFTTYVADGVILATPTGSTAYALSVRGPIIDPRHQAILLAPVAAHMLFDRSLVLSPECRIEVTVAGDRPARVSVDGRPVAELLPGERLDVQRHTRPARLVTFGDTDFHAVLREKFGLIDR